MPLISSSKKETPRTSEPVQQPHQVESMIIDEAVPDEIDIPGPTTAALGKNVGTSHHSGVTGHAQDAYATHKKHELERDATNAVSSNSNSSNSKGGILGTGIGASKDDKHSTSYDNTSSSSNSKGGILGTGIGASKDHKDGDVSHSGNTTTYTMHPQPGTTVTTTVVTDPSVNPVTSSAGTTSHGTHGSHTGHHTSSPTHGTTGIAGTTGHPSHHTSTSPSSNYSSQTPGYGTTAPTTGYSTQTPGHSTTTPSTGTTAPTTGYSSQTPGYGSNAPTTGYSSQTPKYGSNIPTTGAAGHPSSTTHSKHSGLGTDATIAAGTTAAGASAQTDYANKHPQGQHALKNASAYDSKDKSKDDTSLTDKIKEKLHIGSKKDEPSSTTSSYSPKTSPTHHTSSTTGTRDLNTPTTNKSTTTPHSGTGHPGKHENEFAAGAGLGAAAAANALGADKKTTDRASNAATLAAQNPLQQTNATPNTATGAHGSYPNTTTGSYDSAPRTTSVSHGSAPNTTTGAYSSTPNTTTGAYSSTPNTTTGAYGATPHTTTDHHHSGVPGSTTSSLPGSYGSPATTQTHQKHRNAEAAALGATAAGAGLAGHDHHHHHHDATGHPADRSYEIPGSYPNEQTGSYNAPTATTGAPTSASTTGYSPSSDSHHSAIGKPHDKLTGKPELSDHFPQQHGYTTGTIRNDSVVSTPGIEGTPVSGTANPNSTFAPSTTHPVADDASTRSLSSKAPQGSANYGPASTSAAHQKYPSGQSDLSASEYRPSRVESARGDTKSDDNFPVTEHSTHNRHNHANTGTEFGGIGLVGAAAAAGAYSSNPDDRQLYGAPPVADKQQIPTTKLTPSNFNSATQQQSSPSAYGSTPSATQQQPSSYGSTPSATQQQPSSYGSTPSATQQNSSSSAYGTTPSTTQQQPSSYGTTSSATQQYSSPSATQQQPSAYGTSPSATQQHSSPTAYGATPSSATNYSHHASGTTGAPAGDASEYLTETQQKQVREHYEQVNKNRSPGEEKIEGVLVVPIPGSQMPDAMNTPRSQLSEKYLKNNTLSSPSATQGTHPEYANQSNVVAHK